MLVKSTKWAGKKPGPPDGYDDDKSQGGSTDISDDLREASMVKSQAQLLRAMRRRLTNRDSKADWQDRGSRDPR